MMSERAQGTDRGIVRTDEPIDVLEAVLEAARTHDRPDLVQRLQSARRDLGAVLLAGKDRADVARVAEQAARSLQVDLLTRRAELTDPARSARVAAELDRARARWRSAKDAAEDWPLVLGEGFAALNSDLEFGVRTRGRAVLTAAEEGIDQGDPGKHRKTLESWVQEHLTLEAGNVQGLLSAGVGRVTGQLASSLQLDRPPAAQLALTPPDQLVAGLSPWSVPVTSRGSWSSRLLTVGMPSYGGLMMALVLSRYLGLHLSNWMMAGIAVVLSLVMGGAALAGDRGRLLDRRRGEAKMAVRSRIDEFSMALAKQVRDTLRGQQSQLRSAVAADASARIRQAGEELDAAEDAAEALDRGGRELAEVEADLVRTAELCDRARGLLDVPAARRLFPVP
jgi:hypothetical protein